ncbi:MAG: PD40 domain-containing protein [Verrucomicrobia bacterium]|nr:PD40 domain-containing protein [Verrucomicrobiota bacterium]
MQHQHIALIDRHRSRSGRGRELDPRARFLLAGLLLTALWLAPRAGAADALSLKHRLAATPFKIAYESYVNSNSDLFVINADGSHPVNLTRTPDENEHYPQVSPDGTRICFVSDRGEGRDTIRSVYYMGIDGKHRVKVADYAREPFWSPDGRTIGFLGQEYPKFNVMDYYTKGMFFFDLKTGKITPHVNTERLHHLYNPSFSQNGRWIAATVHAGMGYGHAILLIEAHGTNIFNLGIPGCRPCLSPDGRQIAWGPGDHELAVAPIDLDSAHPTVGPRRVRILDEKNKIYHIDWSPDSRFLSFSRGPDGEGDLGKPGTFQAACEIMGVYAGGWNLDAVSAEQDRVIDLATATPADVAILTTNGDSNKEPAWFWPHRPARLSRLNR